MVVVVVVVVQDWGLLFEGIRASHQWFEVEERILVYGAGFGSVQHNLEPVSIPDSALFQPP